MIIDEKNIRKSVLNLAMPSVAEQTLIMVVGVVSTIFVGHIGNEAIDAVGMINILLGFIIALFVALSTGSTVMVARLIGEQNPKDAQEVVKQSIVLGTSFSIIVCGLCYVFAHQLITLFFGGADPKVIVMAALYMKITLITLPLGLLNIIISGSLRGAGDTKTPMIIAAIVNVINVILCTILIFGFGSFKGLGVAGAAYAVAISRACGGFLSLIAIRLPKALVKVNNFKKFRIKFSVISRVLRVGIPAAGEQIVMQGGFVLLQIVIVGMGTVYNSVYQIAMSINSVCYMPLWGFGMAATTLVGQCLGGRKPILAEKCGWQTLKITVVMSTILSILLFTFSSQLVSMYSNDLETIRIGAMAIKVYSFSQPFIALVIVFSGALRGAGDIIYVMITGFIGIWAFRILLTVVFSSIFGFMGVWVAIFLDFFIRSIMYLVRFRRGRWKEIVL